MILSFTFKNKTNQPTKKTNPPKTPATYIKNNARDSLKKCP